MTRRERGEVQSGFRRDGSWPDGVCPSSTGCCIRTEHVGELWAASRMWRFVDLRGPPVN